MPTWPWERRRSEPTPEQRVSIAELVRAGDTVTERLPALAEAAPTGAGARVAGSGPTRQTMPMSDGVQDSVLKGFDVANRSRKATLYEVYVGESWVSACVEAISSRMISGGWALKPADPKHPDDVSRESVQEFCNWINPDEDLSQCFHDLATDLLWAGECYGEIVFKGGNPMAGGKSTPYEFYTVDPLSMDYVLGADSRSIDHYVQYTDHGKQLELDPAIIFRVWFADPRNRYRALSPIEKLLNPITLDTYLQLSDRKYFEHGNRGDLGITLKSGGRDEANRLLKWIRESFLGVKNAHLPLVTFGDIDAKVLGSRATIDVLGRRKYSRDEILAVYKVPPYALGIVEHGGIGSGSLSDSQDKQFLHTAVDPVKQRILAPWNFRIVNQGFGVDDWVVDTVYADLRDTKEITEIHDKQIRGGQRTMNEVRAELRADPVEGGDELVLVTTREVVPVRDLIHIASGQRIATAAANQGAPDPETAAATGKLLGPGVTPPSQTADDEPTTKPTAAKAKESVSRPQSDIESVKVTAEFAAWQRVALNRVREGRPLKDWRSQTLPTDLVESLNLQLRNADTEERVSALFEAQKRTPKWFRDHLRTMRDDLDDWHEERTEAVLAALNA